MIQFSSENIQLSSPEQANPIYLLIWW